MKKLTHIFFTTFLTIKSFAAFGSEHLELPNEERNIPALQSFLENLDPGTGTRNWIKEKLFIKKYISTNDQEYDYLAFLNAHAEQLKPHCSPAFVNSISAITQQMLYWGDNLNLDWTSNQLESVLRFIELYASSQFSDLHHNIVKRMHFIKKLKNLESSVKALRKSAQDGKWYNKKNVGAAFYTLTFNEFDTNETKVSILQDLISFMKSEYHDFDLEILGIENPFQVNSRCISIQHGYLPYQTKEDPIKARVDALDVEGDVEYMIFQALKIIQNFPEFTQQALAKIGEFRYDWVKEMCSQRIAHGGISENALIATMRILTQIDPSYIPEAISSSLALLEKHQDGSFEIMRFLLELQPHDPSITPALISVCRSITESSTQAHEPKMEAFDILSQLRPDDKAEASQFYQSVFDNYEADGKIRLRAIELLTKSNWEQYSRRNMISMLTKLRDDSKEQHSPMYLTQPQKLAARIDEYLTVYNSVGARCSFDDLMFMLKNINPYWDY